MLATIYDKICANPKDVYNPIEVVDAFRYLREPTRVLVYSKSGCNY